MTFQWAAHDIVGLGLLVFSGVWGGFGLRMLIKDRRRGLAGILIGALALIEIALIVYLAASTSARRGYIDLDVRELFVVFSTVSAAVLLGVVPAALLYYAAKRYAGDLTTNATFAAVSALGIAVVMGFGTAWLYATAFVAEIDEVFTPTQVVDGVHLNVEADLSIQIFENRMVKAPTAMVLGDNNVLYVAGGTGFVWAVVDDNLDGVADMVTEFANDLKQPQGLAWGEGGLFVNENGLLSFLKDTNGDFVYDEKTILIDNFPGEVYALHQNNGLVYGEDRRLYIGSGATSDHRPEENPMAARIFSMNPDGTDLKVFATGIRNPFGMIPAPGGGLFAVDNGSSGCVDTEVQRDDCRPEVKIDVPDELNYIIEGRDYGFPNHFGMPPVDSDTMPPVVTFPEHSAPSGIVLYEGDKLPARFKGQVFVSLWARGEIYRIKLHPIDDVHFTGAPLLFASGLTGPSALLNSPDGGLYVASYSGNAIYHIG